MAKKIVSTNLVAALLVVIVVLGYGLIGKAGNLEPSAAPGPTMKTLDEVEPRMPIPASSIPAATFTISQSGSYYLTGDRMASGTGILVQVDDVTIDLMGYSLIGPGSGVNNGVYMDGRSNVEIRNGTVRGFGASGIYEADGLGQGHRLIDVRAVSNGSYGIYLFTSRCLIKDCTATGNGSTGIHTGSSGIVTGNTACNNGGHGIYTSAYNTLTGNTASNNQSHGIAAGGYCTVTSNTASNNNASGISGGYSSTVAGNTASNNNQSDSTSHGGIYVYTGSLVKGNTLRGNKQNNIYVYSHKNAIEENLMTSSTNGVFFRVIGNFYANNRASDNTTNYAGSVPTDAGDGGGNAGF